MPTTAVKGLEYESALGAVSVLPPPLPVPLPPPGVDPVLPEPVLPAGVPAVPDPPQ
ncbi:MAG TPA: hypothetical protein VLW26_06560 [Steroidobacteraceae bacterium]|nr:hypothetical protein [Steroidobacteraceae bacterium]